MSGNAQTQRGTITVDFGASLAAQTDIDATGALANAEVGDTVVVNPLAAPAAGLVICNPFVSAAGVITVRGSNISAGSIAPGTAVQLRVELIKGTGSI